MTTQIDTTSIDTGIASQSSVLLGYTPERHEALALPGRNRIVVDIDGTLRHQDRDVVPEPNVFAALHTLRDHGYLDVHLPPPGVQPGVWPVRLPLSGTMLLAGLQHEHARRTR